ncbi:hypothetical protein MALU111345_14120 [Marinicrinis lubricantis]
MRYDENYGDAIELEEMDDLDHEREESEEEAVHVEWAGYI